MDTLSFLRMVLPDGGFLASYRSSDAFTQFYNNVDELAQGCIVSDAQSMGISFVVSSLRGEAVSTHPKHEGALLWRRTEQDAVGIKTFVMDIDCGPNKPYPDWTYGLRALGEFLVKSRMPTPMIVFSGSGLHVYWPLLETIDIARWQPLANGLRSAAHDYGLAMDAANTTNCVLGLRPVGSRNPKNGEVVRVIQGFSLDRGYPLGAIEPILRRYAMTSERSELLDRLTIKKEYPPADALQVYLKCKQVKHAVDNAAHVNEQLWYRVMGVAAHCKDPVGTGNIWSVGHPDYNPENTEEKMEQWKANTTGPTMCDSFKEINPNGCKGCPFYKKVRTPAQLGVVHEEITLTEEPPVPIPAPYKFTEQGIKGTVDGTDTDVCDFIIYPVSYGRDERLGYEVVRFRWKRKHEGWRTFILPQEHLIDGSRDFATSLARAGLTGPTMFAERTKGFRIMMSSYTEALRAQNKMTNIYTRMGWKENDTEFVLGDTTYKMGTDGLVMADRVELTTGAQRDVPGMYIERGSIDEWVNMTSFLANNSLFHFMFALGVGFSAPLYNFTGLKGLLLSFYGQTGSGKSLAQRYCQSIYGNHERLHFGANFTMTSLYANLAKYSNTPFTIDEVTKMDGAALGDLCYDISQGREKHRENPTLNAPPPKEWALPLLVSTNRSLSSKLTARGNDTDAQRARMLEFEIHPSGVFADGTDTGRQLYDHLLMHCGGVGRKYIEHLVSMGADGIRAVIKDATDTFAERYNATFSGDERFWEQAIVLMELGLRIAKGQGLIRFNPADATNWALGQLNSIRTYAEESRRTPVDLLNEYITQHVSKTLIMTRAGEQAYMPAEPLPRDGVRIRFELSRNEGRGPFTSGTLFLCRPHFKTWLTKEMNHDWGTYMRYMKPCMLPGKGNNNEVRKKLNAGTNADAADQSNCVAFSLSHEMMSGFLGQATEQEDNVVQLGGVASG